MKITLEFGAQRVKIFSDFRLVTQQTQENFEVKKDRLGKYVKQVAELRTRFNNFQIQ